MAITRAFALLGLASVVLFLLDRRPEADDAYAEDDDGIPPSDLRVVSIASLLDELRAQPGPYPARTRYTVIGTTARQTH